MSPLFSESPLVVFTHPEILRGEGEALTVLFENGLEILHFRKPGLGKEETRQLLSTLPEKWLERIVLHDHHELTGEVAVGGIHFNHRNPVPEKTPASGQLHFSVSAHSFEEIPNFPEWIDEVVFAPVFPSISKKEYRPAYSADEMRSGVAESKARTHQQYIEVILEKDHHLLFTGLGGISEGNLHLVFELGFDRAAVLGTLWNDYAHSPDTGLLIQELHQLKRIAARRAAIFS
ncbi:MAG: thiamine phosphate synthase [Spirochaetia bacterium]|nr:thiamine phosphate synthase [Spirochaetia bacterium]